MKVTAQCDVQTIFDEEKNIFDIAVSYTMVQKNSDTLDGGDKEEIFEETDEGFFAKNVFDD